MIITERGIRKLIKSLISEEISDKKETAPQKSSENEEPKKEKTFTNYEKKKLISWAIENDPVKTNKDMSCFSKEFLPKLKLILDYMRKQGPSPALKRLDEKNILPDKFQPEISTAFRSLKDQQAKLAGGKSKVAGLGFHVCYNEKGEPNSYGADIVDKNYQWGSGKNSLQKMAMWEFFMHMSAACEKAGLSEKSWGGNWSYPRSRPDGNCIVEHRGKNYILTRFGFSEKNSFTTRQSAKIGWDPAHVQAFSDKENAQRIKNISYIGLNYLKNEKKRTV